MLHSTRSKLIVSLLAVSLLAGVVSLLVGGQLLFDAVLREATNRVRLDLNAAREIYQARARTVATALHVTTLGSGFQTDLARRNVSALRERLAGLAAYSRLDIVGVITTDGSLWCHRGEAGGAPQAAPARHPLADLVRERGAAVDGTLVLSPEELAQENPALLEQSRLRLIPTPHAAPVSATEDASGMLLAAAVPVVENGQFCGILYGGILLNRNYEIVDTVRDTVFQNETYRGRGIGTATIFLGDHRIATNVLAEDGQRALGTHVSKEVGERVLRQGQAWSGRAFVVRDWYVSAYEPIRDIAGKVVGILYVGVLEGKYTDLRRHILLLLVGFTAVGTLLAVGLGYALADRTIRPVARLIRASAEVSKGNLSPDVGPLADGELGSLQRTFLDMLAALREHERRQQDEYENELRQSEKQAAIGRLAAGVAHEINNPLTGVLTFTHLLLRRQDLPEEVRSDLQTVARETDRVRKIVKGLLDFARQTRLEPELTDPNALVQTAVSLVANQALIKGVNLSCVTAPGLPAQRLDRNQIESAVLNLLLNALDATAAGGSVVVSTRLATPVGDPAWQGLEIEVADTGCGIPPEHLEKLFDPFFTTKEVGQGTGLGLAVAQGVVARHGGTIRVRSEVGRGSTFTIWLPREEKGGAP